MIWIWGCCIVIVIVIGQTTPHGECGGLTCLHIQTPTNIYNLHSFPSCVAVCTHRRQVGMSLLKQRSLSGKRPSVCVKSSVRGCGYYSNCESSRSKYNVIGVPCRSLPSVYLSSFIYLLFVLDDWPNKLHYPILNRANPECVKVLVKFLPRPKVPHQSSSCLGRS